MTPQEIADKWQAQGLSIVVEGLKTEGLPAIAVANRVLLWLREQAD